MSVVGASRGQKVYHRKLPGGGFVAIEVTAVRTLFGQRRYRGAVIVEQRVDVERRRGHDAPVVASAEADSVGSVLHELFPVAQSNAVLATSVLTRRRGSRWR